MAKSTKYWIGGVLFFCMLISCCLCSWFFYAMTTSTEFRDGYCNEWVAQGNPIEAEPFGFCN